MNPRPAVVITDILRPDQSYASGVDFSTPLSPNNPTTLKIHAGADSLASDRLGCFNLSLEGHRKAVEFMKAFNVPMLVTGGVCHLIP